MEQLIIALISGAAGGNIVGKVLKSLDLGPVGNSIAGVIGGVLTQYMTGGIGADATASILQSIVSGGAGGGVLMAIAGLVKNMMAKNA